MIIIRDIFNEIKRKEKRKKKKSENKMNFEKKRMKNSSSETIF